MNRQELFNRAIRGIREQGGPSITPGGRCMYRGLNGTKCALGHSIPDEKYRKDMEDYVPSFRHYDDAPQFCLIAKIIGCETQADADFAVSLQRVHDSHGRRRTDEPFMPRFLSDARQFALTHNLDASVCD